MTDDEREALLQEAKELREEAFNLELEGDSCHADAKVRYMQAEQLKERAAQ